MTPRSHPLIERPAPSPAGRSSFAGDCQRCDRCWTKLYGCSASKCYCHNHPYEPGGD